MTTDSFNSKSNANETEINVIDRKQSDSLASCVWPFFFFVFFSFCGGDAAIYELLNNESHNQRIWSAAQAIQKKKINNFKMENKNLANIFGLINDTKVMYRQIPNRQIYGWWRWFIYMICAWTGAIELAMLQLGVLHSIELRLSIVELLHTIYQLRCGFYIYIWFQFHS